MQDELLPPARGADALAADQGRRLPYIEPQLIVFGDVIALTHAVGNQGNVDGGVQTFKMLSGV